MRKYVLCISASKYTFGSRLGSALNERDFRISRSYRGIPPPPTPLNPAPGAVFAKSLCKIQIAYNLEVKI